MSISLTLLDFPSYCRGTEHCSRSAVEPADKELCLASENGKHVMVVGLTDGFHNQLACLHHSSKEDESLGAGECSEVGTCLTQHVTRELIDLIGQRIAL